MKVGGWTVFESNLHTFEKGVVMCPKSVQEFFMEVIDLYLKLGKKRYFVHSR